MVCRSIKRCITCALWGTCAQCGGAGGVAADTDCCLAVKKSRIQLQREVIRPSRFGLWMSCCGIIVLNAELKSMNIILT